MSTHIVHALALTTLALATLAGTMAGYTMALTSVTSGHADGTEAYVGTVAEQRVACGQAIAWEGRWRGLAMEVARAKVGPTANRWPLPDADEPATE